MRMARVLGAIGRVCITAGVLILLFVVYQLWGTGIRTAQAQNRLEDDFETALDEAGPTSTTTTTLPNATTTTTVAEPEPAEPTPPVPEGEATARIEIPAIGVNKIVVEGVALADLKKGPGHYPETPLPGQEGNAAIAGHRTTYGAPFNRIDELKPGDEITVTTVQGEFTYDVAETLIVSPNQVEVLEDKGDNRLTLSACHPKYSARQRIVVVAKLAPEDKALPRPHQEPTPLTKPVQSLDGKSSNNGPAIFWGLLCAAIWLVAWLVGRRWRKWPSYLIGFPFFMVSLFFFFEEFSRLLPSNF